jgi:hypothetical protein
MVDDPVYCNDICGLMEELQLQHVPEQWRLFNDPSKFSLTAILIHNGHKHPSITLVHAVHTKESYVNIHLTSAYNVEMYMTCPMLHV